jgi:hypothetical protein
MPTFRTAESAQISDEFFGDWTSPDINAGTMWQGWRIVKFGEAEVPAPHPLMPKPSPREIPYLTWSKSPFGGHFQAFLRETPLQ